MCDALWQTLLETAILSPSPHNIQPWRVLIRDRSTADLYFDRLRLLPDRDRTGSFMIATAGMFIEALSIVAAYHQYQLDYQLDRYRAYRLELLKWLRDFFWQALAQSNQDFWEVTKMFDRQSIEIEIQPYGMGVFSQRNLQTKHQYVAGR